MLGHLAMCFRSPRQSKMIGFTNAFVHRVSGLVVACRWRLEDACGEGWTLMAGNVHDAIRMSGLKRKEAPDFELSRSRPATFLTSHCLLH